MKLRIFLVISSLSIILWGCEEWESDHWGPPPPGDDEVARVVTSSVHGGYFVAGQKYHGDDNDADLFLARFTENGHHEWTTAYSTGMHNEPLAAYETNDDGFLILSERSRYNGVSVVYLLKLDADGRVRWQQDVSNADLEVVRAHVTGDGGFILLGYSGSSSLTTLVRIDADGMIMFRETYGNTSAPVDVRATSSGGFVILSEVGSNGDSSTVKLTRVNAWGGVNWASVIWSWGYWFPEHLAEDPDGGYFIVGERHGQNLVRPLVVKADSRGAYLWRRDYPEAEGSSVYAVVSNWSGLLLAGEMYYGGDHDGFALRATDNGEWLWWRSYGEADNDWIADAIPGNNGGYVLAGTTASFSEAGDTDFYLAKISSDGNLVWETAEGE